MKIFRRLFCILAVLFFFILGISVADKEYFSGSVVGICILTEDRDSVVQLCDFIEQVHCTDIHELCQEIGNSEFRATVSYSKRYYDADVSVMGHIPAGVYDTVVIDLGGNGSTEIVYLKQLKPVAHRFWKTDIPVAASVQNYYISFLSFIGKAEKLTLDFLGYI